MKLQFDPNLDFQHEAIASLNPLCTLHYSATHVDKYHMMYKPDSVDAYQLKLVKQNERFQNLKSNFIKKRLLRVGAEINSQF